MQELQKFWSSRTSRQRLAILGGFAASFLLVLAFVAFAGRVPMALLYSGLDDAQAGPVVAHLEQAAAVLFVMSRNRGTAPAAITA